MRKILAHLPEPLHALWPDPRPPAVAADIPSHRTPSSREARRRTQVRWSLLTGATLTVAGAVLVWALIVGPVRSGSVDPAQILLDPDLGLQRLAAGLLIAGVIMLLGSVLAAFLIARVDRS